MMIVVRLIGNSFPLQLTSSLTNHTPRAQNTRICSKGNYPRNVYVAPSFFKLFLCIGCTWFSCPTQPQSTRVWAVWTLLLLLPLRPHFVPYTSFPVTPSSFWHRHFSTLLFSTHFVGWLLELDNHFSSTVVAPLAGRSKNYIFSLLFPRFGGSLRIIRLLATKTA